MTENNDEAFERCKRHLKAIAKVADREKERADEAEKDVTACVKQIALQETTINVLEAEIKVIKQWRDWYSGKRTTLPDDAKRQ